MPALDLVYDFVANSARRGFEESAVEQTLFARFRHWRGRSGRSYVFSVYAPAECPAYEDAVLMIVSRHDGALACVDLGPLPEVTLSQWRGFYRDRLSELEFQIHVLSDRAPERRALMEDLSALAA